MANEPLPACSATFTRAVCPHERLFEAEYKRCFPHCCPQHVDRSYCGSSLEVLLRLDSESAGRGQAGVDVHKLFVFVRFETQDGESLPAAAHSLSYLRSVSQSESNPEASWLEGVQQTRARGSEAFAGSATFVLNGQPYTKWYYHWGSGANKVQRSTKHVLKAYVFYQTQAGTQMQNKPLELLCTVASPPFTVVSYRRAPLEESAPSHNIVRHSPQFAADAGHPMDSDLRRLVQRHIFHAFQEYEQQHAHDPVDESVRARRLASAEEKQSGFGVSRDLCWKRADNAASSEPPLRYFQTERSRQPTDTTKHEGKMHRRDALEYEEAPPQAQSVRRDTAQEQPDFEAKPPAMVGIPPRRIDTARQFNKGSSAAVLQFMQQQQQADSHVGLQKFTDLAVVHFFASRMTAACIRRQSSMKVVLADAIGQHWGYGVSEATQLAALLLVAAEDPGGASHDETESRSALSVDSNLEELEFLLGELCVWAFSPDNLQLMQSLLSACHPLLLMDLGLGRRSGSGEGGTELATAFLECVKSCWSALQGFLQTRHSTTQSVHELSDAILGAVYSNPEFQDLRLDLRALLQRPAYLLHESKSNEATGSNIPRCNFAGWLSFVAQVREGYLRDQHPGRDLPRSPREGSSACQWTGNWALQPGTLSISRPRAVQRSKQAESDTPSLWTACLGLSQLLHLKLAVAGDPLHTLYVQADPSVLFPGNAWLHLICDGRLRVAPVTPNGLTSLIGGAVGGDYIAYRLESASGDSSEGVCPICLEFYWWPLGQTAGATAFRVLVTLKTATSGAFIEAQINLERGLLEPALLAAAPTPQLQLWTPTERIRAVSSWHSWLSIEGVYARMA